VAESNPQITYTQCPSATAVAEAPALAAVYGFVIRSSQARWNAAGMTSTNGGDAKERSKNDSSARQNYTK
jgi:hypothetical protein